MLIWRRGFSTTRWRHQMEIFSALVALCEGNQPVTGIIPPPPTPPNPHAHLAERFFHHTMTTSNGNFFSVSGPLWGESTGHRNYPPPPPPPPHTHTHTQASDEELCDVFRDFRLKKRLSKQSRRRLIETPLRSLWRHFNAIVVASAERHDGCPHWGLFYWLILIPTCISNCIHYKMWCTITYPFPNFNGYTVEVWQWISNLVSLFVMDVITYPCWD